MGESPEAGHSALVQFGARVRARRKALKLSQEALADRCGLHWTYLGQVERGRRNVSLLNILRIAAALQAGAGELIEGLPTEEKAR
jgi:transcriptional regulator with XRE-family HTH domain